MFRKSPIVSLVALFLLLGSTARAQDATPTPDPDPYRLLEPFTIEAMRAREYPAGEIARLRVFQITDFYTQYFIEYMSDGLRLHGIMQIPPGPGPFPVIVLNHGYIRQADYWSGYETWEAAAYLNRNGYMTVAPDYRSWGDSEWGVSLFHGGLTVDVLNLISALETVPEADMSRIGMWGHSMGGGITMKALAVDDRIDAAVLYATNSADDADLVNHYGPGCLADRRAGRRCNRGEVIPADTDGDVYRAYLDAAEDADFLARVSPWSVLGELTAPVQIHIGTRDTVVPTEWSTKLFNALVAEGVPAEFYWYDGQDHTFRDESWFRFIERVTEFFDSHVKGAS